jgi:hypothetical protein
MKFQHLATLSLLFLVSFTKCTIETVEPVIPEVSYLKAEALINLDQNLPYKADSFLVAISSNSEWTIEPTDDWISASTSSGANSMDVSIAIKTNMSKDFRSGEILFKVKGDVLDRMSISQKGRVPGKPKFDLPTESPFGLISNGSGIELVDIDADGDYDVFTINYNEFSYFENIGTSSAPDFIERDHQPFFDTLTIYADGLEFVDIDYDGDLDLVTIDEFGIFNYENIGTQFRPQFKERKSSLYGTDLAGQDLHFIDIDSDDDLDVYVINNRIFRQQSYFLENIGSKDRPNYKIDLNDPFSQNNQGTGITFADLDDNKIQDAYIMNSGIIAQYANIGTNQLPKFGIRYNWPHGLEYSNGLGFTFADIDADGDLDLFSIDKKVHFVENLNL